MPGLWKPAGWRSLLRQVAISMCHAGAIMAFGTAPFPERVGADEPTPDRPLTRRETAAWRRLTEQLDEHPGTRKAGLVTDHRPAAALRAPAVPAESRMDQMTDADRHTTIEEPTVWAVLEGGPGDVAGAEKYIRPAHRQFDCQHTILSSSTSAHAPHRQ